ncbi:hypothetical protein [Glutamicibacter uratoxydans]|uniref:hypothetical protein n=1 Tax=Glutamicibacter uratoxydans TaxID=43667 RepID=UPI003D6E58C1
MDIEKLPEVVNEESFLKSSGNTQDLGAQTVVDGKIGQQLVNGRVSLTVVKAEIVDSVPMNRSGYVEEEFMVITHDKPSKGAKFVRVDTLIKNTGDTSMDLTCDWVIENKLLDSENRAFDPIDELYLLLDNPQCNVKLQPGLETDMSYVYMIPESASVETFSFRDTSNKSNEVFTNASLR